MKKIQCEMCGSNEVKKINDTTFECQSCGTQYSKDEAVKLLIEMSGKVKIDHSEEVDNAIARGEHFEKQGDMSKAEVYYNQALDMDATNELALQKQKIASELAKLENYYVIAQKLDPQDNVKKFLEQLSLIPNIACDIYKEISIIDVTQKYYTFFFMKNKRELKWSAVSCNRHYENETVWKTKYENGRQKQVPVTQRAERIERTPVKGSHIYDSTRLAIASDKIKSEIQIEFFSQLLTRFENIQNEKYGEYIVDRIELDKLEREDNKLFLNGLELDSAVDKNIQDKMRAEMVDAADAQAQPYIISQIGGDYYENLQGQARSLSHTTAYVCIPVQIIRYAYKGKEYAAISDLVSEKTIPALYPCDRNLIDAQQTIEEIPKLSKYPLLWLCYILALLCSFVPVLVADATNAFSSMEPIVVAGWILAPFLYIIPFPVYYSRKNKAVKNKTDLLNLRQMHLTACKKIFFDEYTDYASAQNAAANANCLDIAQTIVGIFPV